MAHSKKAEKLTNNYITQKVMDVVNNTKRGKQELMTAAGFSLSSVSSNNVENTNLYAKLSSEVINKTGFILNETIDSIEKDVIKGSLQTLNITQKVRLLSTIATVYKGLIPTYKVKKTVKDDNGLETTWTSLS